MRAIRIIIVSCIIVLACFLLSGEVAAQTVDPCWYGCPKDGCPGCGGGGPINTASYRDSSFDICMQAQQGRVKDCDRLFPASKEPVEHKECLERSMSMNEGCMDRLVPVTAKYFIKINASEAFSCPQSDVTVKVTGEEAGLINYDASGCGKKVSYKAPINIGNNAKIGASLGAGTSTNVSATEPCPCVRHCPVGPGSPGGGTTCCEWKCN